MIKTLNFSVGLGLLICAATAMPALAAPTGAINSQSFQVKTYQPEPDGSQRIPELKITIQYTVSNPDPTDVGTTIQDSVSVKPTGATDYWGYGSAQDSYTAPRNSTGLGTLYVTTSATNG